jgi:hypothetical protein
MVILQKKDDSETSKPLFVTRRWPRYPFTSPVEALDILANTRISGRLSDIAREGCYVDTISPFATKALVSLLITKNNQTFKTPAKVVYSQIGMGMGLFFTTVEPNEIQLLDTWLQELSKGEVHEQGGPSVGLEPDIPKTSASSTVKETLSDLITLLSRKNIIEEGDRTRLLRKLGK